MSQKEKTKLKTKQTVRYRKDWSERPYAVALYNVRRGTREWHHEMRHAWQEGNMRNVVRAQELETVLALFATALFAAAFFNGDFTQPAAVFFLAFLPQLILEADADWFAFKATGGRLW